MSNSDYILLSLKELIGIDTEDSFWDDQLVTYINGTFALMHSELGVDPQFSITADGDEKWTDFCEDTKKLAYVIPYMKFKVQQQFDPPTVSAMENAMETNIDLYEFFIRDAFDFEETTTEVTTSA